MNKTTPHFNASGALSGPQIWDVINRESGKDPLVVMPPLYDIKSLNSANVIDLRLGHEFILMRKAELSSLAFGRDDSWQRKHEYNAS
ncbi:MAG: hypothetical protein ACHQ2F_03500 [Desulfobaccales bacterium]